MEFDRALVVAMRQARHIAAFTGAGVSAESGVPTFRDAQTGLWARYRAEDLATPEAFARDPKLVWEWYDWRRQLVSAAAPNPAHRTLARLEDLAPRLTLITQNVDDLHERGGSRNPIHLHGSLHRSKCSREGEIVLSWPPTADVPPPCPTCGAPLRPDVVWFGEALPAAALAEAAAAAQSCDLFLSIGTSTVVHPAAALPSEALANGATVVEINPAPTPLTPHATFALQAPAGEILPQLIEATWPKT